jgi:aconitate hydratase
MATRYDTATNLSINGESYTVFPFASLGDPAKTATLPYCMKILLENLLRHGSEEFVTDDDVDALLNWDPEAEPSQEVAFVPSRVLLQDFTGVPAIVDLAAMRDAIVELGEDASRINPLSPVDLVIDHSVSVDHFATPDALERNTEIEIQRNMERYRFLRWGQQSLDNFTVVPPGTGIVHQVGSGGAAGQAARQLEAHDLGNQHGHRLSQHRRLGLDAAHAPAQHAQAVDHGGV